MTGNNPPQERISRKIKKGNITVSPTNQIIEQLTILLEDELNLV